MTIAVASVLSAVLALAVLRPAAAAETQDTEIAGVTMQIAFIRQYGGVLHLGIDLHNGGSQTARMSSALQYGEVTVIDPKSRRKYFPLKDANGHFLAGPVSDWNGAGGGSPIFPRTPIRCYCCCTTHFRPARW